MQKTDIRLCVSALLLTTSAHPLLAGDLFWDAWPSGAAGWKEGVTDGSGVWKAASSSDLSWSADRTTAGNQPWNATSRAVFGNGHSRNVGELITSATVELQNGTPANGVHFAQSQDGFNVEYTLGGPGTLTLSGPVQVDYRGTINAQIAGALTKNGDATLTLNGTSSYTGATNVNAGALIVNGTLGDTLVTVASGATLGGSGIIGMSSAAPGLTVAGTISPGLADSISTLTTRGTQTWAAGASYEVTVGADSPNTLQAAAGATHASDLLVMDALSLDGFFTVNLVGEIPAAQPTTVFEWVIAAVTGGLPMNFDLQTIGLTNSTNAQTQGMSLFTRNTGGTDVIGVSFSYQAVPEATTMVLGIMAIAPLLLHRRKRPDASIA